MRKKIIIIKPEGKQHFPQTKKQEIYLQKFDYKD